VIVTANIKDFPASALGSHGIIAITPDDFIFGLLTENPTTVVEALRTDRASLKHPPMTTASYLAALERTGLVETAAVLRTLGEPR
jgi:hypothetical protein